MTHSSRRRRHLYLAPLLPLATEAFIASTISNTPVRGRPNDGRHIPFLSTLVVGSTQTTDIPSEKNSLSINKSSSHKRRVVIIGSGVGGLASAARIAAETRNWKDPVEIVVVEKNARDKLGGRCGSFSVDVEGVGTFRHERGPSLLLLKDEYESLFADCMNIDSVGPMTAAERYGLVMKPCIPAYKVVFDDGMTVDLGFPRAKCAGEFFTVEEIKRIQQLEQKSIQQLNSIEPDGFQKWQDYLDTCAAFLDCGLPNFIEEKIDLGTLPKFLIESLKENAKRWPLQPHATMLSNLFSSPKMIALASFQDLYVGLEPYVNAEQIGGGVLRKTAPAVFGLLAALELHPTNKKCGVFAPVGGFRQVAEAMYHLCHDCGVQFMFDCSVTRVDATGVHFINKQVGSEPGSHFFPADLIICNGDLPVATQTIMADRNTPPTSYETYDWDDRFDYSTGVVAFHWSVSLELGDLLNTHNVFMSAKSKDDAERSWDVLRCETDNQSNAPTIGVPFNFYVHWAGKTDPTSAPPGHEAVTVLVPCQRLRRNRELASLSRDEAIKIYKQQFDEKVVSKIREAVFARLAVVEGLKDLKEYIVHEVIDTPGTYADYYNLAAGVPFGLSHGLSQLSITRPSDQSSSHDNVMYVGASSRPGNGVPLVLIGAKAVASKAIRRLADISRKDMRPDT
eukprot:CCRYP_012648-RA/>CCRYP_012648-RA protein AED:0.10 eAED:0.10 QI:92/1/1/1/0.6/0.5/6/1526/676